MASWRGSENTPLISTTISLKSVAIYFDFHGGQFENAMRSNHFDQVAISLDDHFQVLLSFQFFFIVRLFPFYLKKEMFLYLLTK